MSGPLVVSRGWLVGASVAEQLPAGFDLGQLALRAASYGARVVYVVDGQPAPSALAVPSTSDEPVWRWRVNLDGQAGGIKWSVSVVLLETDEGRAAGPWQAMGPRELLAAFSAFERLCGVPWSDSVGHTAEALILATHPRGKGGTVLDRDVELPEPILGSVLELAWQSWRRPLTDAEAGCRYVHAFDANAQYLAAWSGVELGHGTPVLVDSPTFDKRLPGIWRVPDLDRIRRLDHGLPDPWTPGRDWYTTPTLARVREMYAGMPEAELLDPVEAYVWQSHSRFLRGAAERLRDARAAAMDELVMATARLLHVEDDADAAGLLQRLAAADAVLDAVKAIYRVQTGRLGMEGRSARSGWARPDWGHAIRAQARVNLHRRLARLSAVPFAIATDGLLFASDEPDGLQFAERIGLPVGDGLGMFTHDATARLEGELRLNATGSEGRGRRSRGVGGLFAAVKAGAIVDPYLEPVGPVDE